MLCPSPDASRQRNLSTLSASSTPGSSDPCSYRSAATGLLMRGIEGEEGEATQSGALRASKDAVSSAGVNTARQSSTVSLREEGARISKSLWSSLWPDGRAPPLPVTPQPGDALSPDMSLHTHHGHHASNYSFTEQDW